MDALVWKCALLGFTIYTMFLVTVGFSLGAMLQGTEQDSGAEPDFLFSECPVAKMWCPELSDSH
jgi:hypothetical protein